jgi:hypothetical protein
MFMDKGDIDGFYFKLNSSFCLSPSFPSRVKGGECRGLGGYNSVKILVITNCDT